MKFNFRILKNNFQSKLNKILADLGTKFEKLAKIILIINFFSEIYHYTLI